MIEALRRNGVRVIPYILGSNELGSDAPGTDMPISHFKNSSWRHPILRVRGALARRRFITKGSFDVILAAHIDSLSMLPRFVSRRTPVVVDTHNVYGFLEELRVRRRLSVRYRERLLLRRADAALTVSRRDLTFLTKHGFRGPTAIWANGFDPIEWPEQAVLGEEPALAFFGSLWYPVNLRGLEWFLERVWPKVRDAVPEATFKLVGPGDLRPSIKNAPGVRHLGWVESPAAAIAGCAAIVLPYLGGPGAPVKLPEALASGIPVICSPGISEDAVMISYANVGTSADEFVSLCTRALLGDSDIRATGEAARAFAVNHLQWSQTGSEGLSLILAMADQHRSKCQINI